MNKATLFSNPSFFGWVEGGRGGLLKGLNMVPYKFYRVHIVTNQLNPEPAT